MGGGGGCNEMTNVKNSNLKVPPLKIVLNSATSGGSDRSSSTSPSSESESLDSNLTIISENQQQDRLNKSGEQQKDDPAQNRLDKLARQAAKNAASGSGGGGNPSNENHKNNSATTVSGNRRSLDVQFETTSSSCSSNSNNDSTANREQITSLSNQRITRSSQRAAQQNKSENETNGDETHVIETQDSSSTNSNTINNNNKSVQEQGQRKVKRRKGEVQESEQDSNQQVPQQPVIMANICPADYQLPSQNSFELYRDIRNRPYSKLMKLNLVQPKMPQGFKDYLLHSGPYLLDGNKVGNGLSGFMMEACTSLDYAGKTASRDSNCVPNNRLRPSINYRAARSSTGLSQQKVRQQASYVVPKLLETPKHLASGSPLCELFQDQEKARQKMRIQHLKERERSVLSAEQEILRAYNRVAIADTRQTSHLSACTYFYYQERYHYIDERNNYLDSINQKDSSQSRESSDSCNAENINSVTTDTNVGVSSVDRLKVEEKADEQSNECKSSQGEQEKVKPSPPDRVKVEKGSSASDPNQTNSNGTLSEIVKPPVKKRKGELNSGDTNSSTSTAAATTTTTTSTNESTSNGSNNGCDIETDDNNKGAKSLESLQDAEGDITNTASTKTKKGAIETETLTKESDETKDDKIAETAEREDSSGKLQEHNETLSDAELKDFNKANLISDLHDIDEKWAQIRHEMFVRHKNESDSLYAVQCLEWEWKAKEIGECDVRLSPRIDAESVPRVEVSTLDY